MHNPKLSEEEVQRFEKEVQQKMGELEFSPSAAVWANVEKAVRVEKKRRVPFFWLFFLPALLLMGGAGIYFMGSHRSSLSLHSDKLPGQTAKATKGSDESNSQPANNRPDNVQSGNDKSGNQPETAQSGNGQSHNHQPGNAPLPNNQQAGNQPTNDPQLANDPLVTTQPAKTTQPANDPPSADSRAFTMVEHPAKSDHLTRNDQAATITNAPTVEPAATRSGASGAGAIRPGSARTRQTSSRRPAGKGRTQALAEEEEPDSPEQLLAAGTAGQSLAAGTPPPDQSARASIHLTPVHIKSMADIQAAPLAKSPVFIRTRLSTKGEWEAGFTGGVGISSVNQTLFKGSAAVASDSRILAAPMPVTGVTVQKNYVSKIRPDLSFWAGIFLQKPILNNLSVSVGLNLHYYSTKMCTGEKVDNDASNYFYSATSSLLSYAAAPTVAQSYPYYAAGDKQTFINRYYFLEVPASIQWQIGHSRIMPLFWEVGGSLSYLVSSNAIYYNTKAGVYYKDGSVTNRTQFNLSTAFMVGIPFKGLQMQIGPQVQYGLTSLLNAPGSGGQHLFYGGLKLVILPGKWHKTGRRYPVTGQ